MPEIRVCSAPLLVGEGGHRSRGWTFWVHFGCLLPAPSRQPLLRTSARDVSSTGGHIDGDGKFSLLASGAFIQPHLAHNHCTFVQRYTFIKWSLSKSKLDSF